MASCKQRCGCCSSIITGLGARRDLMQSQKTTAVGIFCDCATRPLVLPQFYPSFTPRMIRLELTASSPVLSTLSPALPFGTLANRVQRQPSYAHARQRRGLSYDDCVSEVSKQLTGSGAALWARIPLQYIWIALPSHQSSICGAKLLKQQLATLLPMSHCQHSYTHACRYSC